MPNLKDHMMPCSTCSKTAKVIKTMHRYSNTDNIGDWFICDSCGITSTCFPNQRSKEWHLH